MIKLRRFPITKKRFRLILTVLFWTPLIICFQNCSQGGPGGLTDLSSSSDGNGILGAFKVEGVSGTDQKVGAVLLAENRPTIHWTASQNAESYEVALYSSQDKLVCPVQSSTGLSLYLSDCHLADGAYKLRVKSLALDTFLEAQVFNFFVDTAGPQVAIQPVIIENLETNMTFSVTSSVGSLTEVVCSLTGPSSFVPITDGKCLNQTKRKYFGLPYGSYVFSITAQDQFGVSSSSAVTFDVLRPICEPFDYDQPDCDRRIKAQLYFHTSTSGQPVWSSVNTYLQQGIPSGTLYFTDLWVPTRSFTSGFPSVSNRTEYFALDIRTKLQTSQLMPEGQYQLGILSDDGSIVSIVNQDGTETVLINQDGYTPTKYGYSQTPISLKEGVRLNLRVRYFQGPRDALALVLLYRPWSQSNINTPIDYGLTTPNFFGPFPVPLKDPLDRSYPGTLYLTLVGQGWAPVPRASFWHPDYP